MEDKNMFGYEYEEKAKVRIQDTPSYNSGANGAILALAYATLASVDVQRKIASVLVDIEVAIRDLVKTMEKNRKEE